MLMVNPLQSLTLGEPFLDLMVHPSSPSVQMIIMENIYNLNKYYIISLVLTALYFCSHLKGVSATHGGRKHS